jgi:hypothetical protein
MFFYFFALAAPLFLDQVTCKNIMMYIRLKSEIGVKVMFPKNVIFGENGLDLKYIAFTALVFSLAFLVAHLVKVKKESKAYVIVLILLTGPLIFFTYAFVWGIETWSNITKEICAYMYYWGMAAISVAVLTFLSTLYQGKALLGSIAFYQIVYLPIPFLSGVNIMLLSWWIASYNKMTFIETIFHPYVWAVSFGLSAILILLGTLISLQKK